MGERLINRDEIESFDRLFRVNLMNSISGYKPANLIATCSKDGNENLAIFSSVVHMGSHPPLIGHITRPTTVPRDTFSNIKNVGYYTINHVNTSIISQAHQTSAKYTSGVSEFEKTGLNSVYVHNFPAPFVQESKLKIGMKLVEFIPLKVNNTILVIGEIEMIIANENAIKQNGSIDLVAIDTIALSGLDTYYKTEEIMKLPYARP